MVWWMKSWLPRIKCQIKKSEKLGITFKFMTAGRNLIHQQIANLSKYNMKWFSDFDLVKYGEVYVEE